jgi:hypothetical protein
MRGLLRNGCSQNATNKTLRFSIYLFQQNALHVSGGSSAHHQELKLYIQLLVLSNCNIANNVLSFTASYDLFTHGDQLVIVTNCDIKYSMLQLKLKLGK